MHAPAIMTADRAGLITSWDAGAQRLFGYPAQEALGQSLDLIVPPGQRDRHWPGFRRAMESGQTAGDLRLAFPARHQDGRVFQVQAQFTLLRDAANAVIGVRAVCTAA